MTRGARAEARSARRRYAARGEHGERGYLLVWFALLLVALMLLAAFSVDLGFWYLERGKAERAADAAALAGVVYRTNDQYPPATADDLAEEQALKVAGVHGYNASEVTVSFVDLKTGLTLPRNQLQVRIRRRVPNFFFQVVGASDTQVSSVSTAEYNTPLALGSPSNVLGREPLGPGDVSYSSTNPAGSNQSQLWVEIQGPRTPTEHGDRYQANNCTNDALARISQNCNGARDNLDFEDEGGSDGYYYKIRTRKGGKLQVQLYDPAFSDQLDDCSSSSIAALEQRVQLYSEWKLGDLTSAEQTLQELLAEKSTLELERTNKWTQITALIASVTTAQTNRDSYAFLSANWTYWNNQMISLGAPNFFGIAYIPGPWHNIFWPPAGQIGVLRDRLNAINVRLGVTPWEGSSVLVQVWWLGDLDSTPPMTLVSGVNGAIAWWEAHIDWLHDSTKLPGDFFTDRYSAEPFDAGETATFCSGDDRLAGNPGNPFDLIGFLFCLIFGCGGIPGFPGGGDGPAPSTPSDFIVGEDGSVQETQLAAAREPAASDERADLYFGYDGHPLTEFTLYGPDGAVVIDSTSTPCQQTFGTFRSDWSYIGILNLWYMWANDNGITWQDLEDIPNWPDLFFDVPVLFEPSPATDGFGHAFLDTYHQWVNLCSEIDIPAAGDYVLRVNANVGNDPKGRGANRFSIRAALTDDAEGIGRNVSVFGAERMALNINLNGTNDAFLTKILPSNGFERTLKFQLYDPGDVELCYPGGQQYIYTDPNSGVQTPYTIAYCTRSGVTADIAQPENNPGVPATIDGTGYPGTMQIKRHDGLVLPCQVQYSKGGPVVDEPTCTLTTDQPGNGGLNYATGNGRILTVWLDVPADYTCTYVDPADLSCWWKAIYTFPSMWNGLDATLSDTTTWTATLEDTKVRLVE